MATAMPNVMNKRTVTLRQLEAAAKALGRPFTIAQLAQQLISMGNQVSRRTLRGAVAWALEQTYFTPAAAHYTFELVDDTERARLRRQRRQLDRALALLQGKLVRNGVLISTTRALYLAGLLRELLSQGAHQKRS